MAEEKDRMVTGQVIFREATEQAPNGSDRKLMMVVGLIAVPRDYPFKGEHQYTISSPLLPLLSGRASATLVVHEQTGVDRTEDARGMDLGYLLTQPIWRC